MKRFISTRVALRPILAAVFICLIIPAMQAQPMRRGMSRGMYNPKTETVIKGTVEDVTQATRGMMTGTHLTVKTADGNMTFMLGPSSFITDKGFSFAKGDQIEVTGSKVTIEGADSLIAREVVKDGKTLTLRDKDGIPQWSRGAARRSGSTTKP